MIERREFPTRRQRIFDPPAELAEIRADAPVCPVRLPDGADALLATGHAEVRAALSDERWSARQDLMRGPDGSPPPMPAAPGFFVRMDSPEHGRYRRLVARYFSQRRLRELVPTIVRIVDDQLDTLEARGPGADLVSLFRMPVPATVVGTLLGVEEGLDTAAFARASSTAVSLTASADEVRKAMQTITGQLRNLVSQRRASPGAGLISDLVHDPDLDDEEIVALATLLLVAGHETTSNMASLGTFALLCHPAQGAAFRQAVVDSEAEDANFEGRIARAVDELLRFLTVNTFGAMRVAKEHLVLGETDAPAMTTLICSLAAANRDPNVFENPDALNIDRVHNPHVAFGHGPHLCSGRQLARLELQIMLARLWRRFPNLALAVAPQEVPLRLDMSVYGVHRLPITW